MKKTLKTLGVLVLGAVLGYAMLIGVNVLRLMRAIKTPGFLASSSMQGTDPLAMSNPELQVWNEMRDKIRSQAYQDVDELIGLADTEIDVAVVPAKETFSSDEAVLAEIRIKNVSGRTLHVNEPRSMRLTPVSYHYKGYYQDDYDLSISPLESTWMKTLSPGEKLSLPTLIAATNIGPHKINYSLSAFRFTNGKDEDHLGVSPVIKRASCTFTVKETDDIRTRASAPTNQPALRTD